MLLKRGVIVQAVTIKIINYTSAQEGVDIGESPARQMIAG